MTRGPSSTIAGPASDIATVLRSRWASLRPWRARSRWRATFESSRCSRCATAETRKPGANSRVTAAPPTCAAASSTRTLRPARARYAAHTRPLCPPPTTMTRFGSVIAPSFRHGRVPAQVVEDFARGIRTGRRHDAAPRMRRRAAHVHAAHRSAVLRESRERAVEEQLVEGQLALEDVALGEADFRLEFLRRAHLRVQHERTEVRAVARNLVEHGF